MSYKLERDNLFFVILIRATLELFTALPEYFSPLFAHGLFVCISLAFLGFRSSNQTQLLCAFLIISDLIYACCVK